MRSAGHNFAARLLDRVGAGSRLIDAARGDSHAGAQIRSGVTGFAAGFVNAGLRQGDRVVICCALDTHSSLAYLGAMYAGLVPVPLSEATFAASGEQVCGRSGARALWSARGVRCDWAAQRGCIALQGALPAPAAHAEPAACADGDLAALMTTSGSTGTPRLVRVTHGNLIANTEAIIRSQSLGDDELAMLILPVSYCFGASVLHSHLYQGGGVVFDSRFMFPDKVLRAISEHQCTTFAGVPTVYNILLRRSNVRSIALPSLRRFLQAGGALPLESVRQMREIVPHAGFFVMYGQTEATARISCLSPQRLIDKGGSVGLPLDNLEIRIVDADGRSARASSPGEIWVRGPSVADGYYDDAPGSATKFHDGWLRTGDLATQDPDGFLWLVGRTGEFVKMRGVRVGLAEIEARFAGVPGIVECAAVGVPHAEAGEALALYVVAETGADEVLAALRRCMPPEWICDSVTLVAELPRTGSGKLARSLISELAPLAVRRLTPGGPA
ncbi:MAG: acyl--CoA ligase [Proteobacteria bacterium]|nr:acyl--CoA ligase [Pseudomonadota bacterium]